MSISNTFNMDCMEYMRSLPDNAFTLAVVDPPYGGGNDTTIDSGRRFGARFNRYKEQVDARWDIAPEGDYFTELFRISKNQVIWGANYFPYMPPSRCFLVWRKLTISESFSMAMAEYAWTSFRNNAKVFDFAPQRRKDDMNFHVSQKPIELYQWIYRLFAKPGDTILDTHLGSGSSRIAAWFAGLDFTGIELNPDYYRMQEDRFMRWTQGITNIGDHSIVEPALFDK